MSDIKYPSLSKEAIEVCKKKKVSNSTKKKFKGLTPLDRYGCACSKDIVDMYAGVNAGKKPKYVECKANKDKKYKEYYIQCQNCLNTVAVVYATDEKLIDYVDLHYVSETDGIYWYGCFSLNISPIDGKIGIECSCGQDTRDFRANNTLPYSEMSGKLVENLKGRDFGLSDSKFKAIEVK